MTSSHIHDKNLKTLSLEAAFKVKAQPHTCLISTVDLAKIFYVYLTEWKPEEGERDVDALVASLGQKYVQMLEDDQLRQEKGESLYKSPLARII